MNRRSFFATLFAAPLAAIGAAKLRNAWSLRNGSRIEFVGSVHDSVVYRIRGNGDRITSRDFERMFMNDPWLDRLNAMDPIYKTLSKR